MSVKRFDCSELYDKFSGRCVVVGCGVSAPLIKPHLDDVFTIGVNDAFMLGDLDMLLVNDAPYRWSRERLEKMFESNVRYFCSRYVDDFLWVRCGAFVDYKLCGRNDFGLDTKDGRLGNNRTTLFAAVCLAYHLGFRDIGMLGNDFIENHFYKVDGKYNLSSDFTNINNTFKQLEKDLGERGCRFVNLSNVSRIEVTKVPLNDWLS